MLHMNVPEPDDEFPLTFPQRWAILASLSVALIWLIGVTTILYWIGGLLIVGAIGWIFSLDVIS